MAKTHKEFKHNYNQVSREIMYNFFNQQLKLGQAGTIKEQPFVPATIKEMSVYDAEHPVPKDTVDANGVRRYWTTRAEQDLQALLPKDEKTAVEFHRIIGTALRVMMSDKLPASQEIVAAAPPQEEGKDGLRVIRHTLTRQGAGEAVSVQEIHGERKGGSPPVVVVWVDPAGLPGLWKDGSLIAPARKLIDQKAGILAVEVLRTGATAGVKRTPVNRAFPGYTFGYNRPLVAERVHDILTAVAFARGQGAKVVHLVGQEAAGPWVIMARALCGDAVSRTAADMHGFRFEKIVSLDDDMMLPGALRYGGLSTFAGLVSPHELYLHNVNGTGPAQFLDAAYRVAGAPGNLQRVNDKADTAAVSAWLLR